MPGALSARHVHAVIAATYDNFWTCAFPIYGRLRDNRCAFNPSFEHFQNLRYLFDVRRAEKILPFSKHIFNVILLRIFI